MKAICIIGSPRPNGSSAFITDKIIKGMKQSNIEVNRYCLGEMKISFCLGCKNCHKTGRCVQSDDMDIIMEELIASDIVVIASPSYWGDVTGQLKVFFDRSTPYSETNPNDNKVKIPEGKKGIAVAIRAGHSERENIHIIESIEHYFGHLGIKPAGSLSVTGVDTISDLHNKECEINIAYELGKSIME